MKILTARSGPRTLIGLLAALGLIAALTMPALANHDPADGPEVMPTTEAFPGGEAACQEGVAYRFNSPIAGDDVDLDLGGGVTATVTIVSGGDSLTFTVENGVASVVKVKGGVATEDDVNVYDYSGMSGGGIAHDDGLTTPSGQGISHVDFCIVVPTAEESLPAESLPAESEPAESQPAESQPAEESELPTEESEQPAQSIREDTQGGNPTATPTGGSLPNTAMGDFSQVPATVLSLVLLGALAAMVYVRLARQR